MLCIFHDLCVYMCVCLCVFVFAAPRRVASHAHRRWGVGPSISSKHVVFGKVIDGYDVVDAMEEVNTDGKDRPTVPITIVDCGEAGGEEPLCRPGGGVFDP